MSRAAASLALLAALLLSPTPRAAADQASGTFSSPKLGPISPKYAAAYVVRDQGNARMSRTEILLADAPIDAAALQAAFDPHMTAINLDALRDRNYILLWVAADGYLAMNATYSKTMTQFLNDTSDGLKVTWTTNSPTRVEGRITAAKPLKTMDGETYTVDLRFGVDVPKPPAGDALPAGGGEPGKAFAAFVAAAQKKNWATIKAGASPEALKMFDKSYNTPAENAAGAADLLNAWVSTAKMKITGGQLRGDTAILEVEGEMFPGQLSLSRVRMIKSGAVWQFDRAARAGMIR